MPHIPTISSVATGRRAKLRKRSLADYKPPKTEGPHGSAEAASLIFTGVPEAAAGKAVTQAEKMALEHSKWVITHLKPILSPSAWKQYLKLLGSKVK